jgi:hypothetical protein
MGRKQKLEDEIDDINYLPYLTWRDWISNLANYEVGIHLMRTHAAGTFAMNCAFHGIPCIGYKGLDTQELCHPELTVEVGDLKTAIRKAKLLRGEDGESRVYYKYCSEQAREGFEKYYTEEKWLKDWNSINETD